MSLQPCRECGQVVSTTAPTCPHCGARRPAGRPPQSGRPGDQWAWGCLAVVVVGATFALSISGTRTPAASDAVARVSTGAWGRVSAGGSFLCPSREAIRALGDVVTSLEHADATTVVVRYAAAAQQLGCLRVPAGTEVRVEHRATPYVEVRRAGDAFTRWMFAHEVE